MLIFPWSNIVEAAIIFAIVDLIQRSIGPIKEFSGKIANIQRAMSGLIRISEFNNDLKNDQFYQVDESLENTEFDLISLKIDVPYFVYPRKGKGRKVFSLNNISFEAEKGELIGVIGESGCGKSTLLHIIAGNIIPNNSNIIVRTIDNNILTFKGDHQKWDLIKNK